VYQALKPRWGKAVLELEERGPVLTLRPAASKDALPAAAVSAAGVPAAGDASIAAVSFSAGDTGGGPAELRISLDRDAGILVEAPRGNNGFRRVTLEKFRAYDETDRVLRRLLKEAEALGVYSDTRPERIPYILYDYARALEEELLAAADETAPPESLPGKRAAWIDARSEYFKSLDEFLYGPAEMTLIGGYEEIIATEKLGEGGLEKLRNLRDGLIRSFVEMRETHRELTELRSALSEALVSSFCVMGPRPEYAADGAAAPVPLELAALSPAEGAVESSLLLANALLTGRHIIPGETRYVLFWSLLLVFVILAVIHLMRPPALLALGFAASVLCAAGFGWSFIISAYWIDPFIPAGSCLAGTFVMFCLSSLVISRGTRRFRLAYGPVVNRACLKQLIRTGQPPLSETINARAAVIAVKNAGFLKQEDREEPLLAARAAAEFRNAVSRTFRKVGAVILGYEGDTVLVCFGSPLERIYLGQIKTETQYGDEIKARSNHHPAVKAMGFITELLQPASGNSAVKSWRFGLDCGVCAFFWSEGTGYTAVGRPMIRARILSSLASRYRARILITDSIRERLNQPVRKLHTLGEQGGEGKEYFYEPLIRK
jgi:class 3 adenylate cyclase